MTGIEYMLGEVMEPHFFVISKQKRDSPEKVTPMLSYYLLDGSIFQAPTLCNIFAARIGRALYYIKKAFTSAASKLEKIGYVVVDTEKKGATLESKVTKKTIDFKEVKRVDHILTSLQRKQIHKEECFPFCSFHQPFHLHLHHFQKVILQQLEKLTPALKPNKQESCNLLLLTPSSIKWNFEDMTTFTEENFHSGSPSLNSLLISVFLNMYQACHSVLNLL